MFSKFYSLFLYAIIYNSVAFAQVQQPNFLYRCNDKLINVIMEDLFTPPVASRIHVYPNIAAYQVLCKANGNLKSLDGQIKDLEKLPDPAFAVDFSLSACIAFTTVAKKMVYSEYMLTDFENTEYTKWLSIHNNDTVLLKHSTEYALVVAQKIITWLKKDNYDYTRTLSRYVLSDSAGSWQPTGPDYANAVEPNWPLIRSLVFDSSNNIKCRPNFAYSESKKSAYYKNALAVYKQSRELDTVKKSIAAFWDCNPNITKSGGHFTYFVHKISPAGHWIGIAGQAVNALGLDEYKTAEVYTMLTLGIFEGIQKCWTSKYQHNSLRPETYINRVISPTWKSYIETPPFPEYPSGHSVISGVSAAVLTRIIPQPYQFTDSTEMYINLPPRHFKSFTETQLNAAEKFTANNMSSTVFINSKNGIFKAIALPAEAQLFPVNGIQITDINSDNIPDLLLAGNDYSTEVETGRNDAGIGLALIGKGDGSFVSVPVTQSGFYAPGNVKCMEKIMIGGKPAYLVGKNGDKLELLQKD